jgi:hypothetical protein
MSHVADGFGGIRLPSGVTVPHAGHAAPEATPTSE